MPAIRKYFPNNALIFCTTRTEIGLPFIASHLMNFLLSGILARAQELYPVKVCHYIFLANHFHMLLVIENPEDISRFIGYVKAESAHVVNRLLNRRQRTIWTDGYDSPLVLTVKDALDVITYIYLNPSRSSLVAKIEEYPGISSWNMYSTQTHTSECKRIDRDAIVPLLSPALSINEQKQILEMYRHKPGTNCTLHLTPDAWMDCFPELRNACSIEINNRLLHMIRQGEAKYAAKRAKEKRGVIGSTSLRRESMTKEYTPSTFGQKSICKCYDKKLRQSVIRHFRTLGSIAKEIYTRWKAGETNLRMPPGLLAPRMPVLASALAIPI